MFDGGGGRGGGRNRRGGGGGGGGWHGGGGRGRGRGGGRSSWGGRPPRPQSYGGQQGQSNICRFFLSGTCSHGDRCRYTHSWTTAKDIDLCAELPQQGQQGHAKVVTSMCMNQTTGQLFTGSQDGEVRVWDCATGACTSQVPVGGEVDSLLLEGEWLFVGIHAGGQGAPSGVKVWNVTSGQQHDLVGHTGAVYALCRGKDMLFSGAADTKIMVWKFNPATSQFAQAGVLQGHSAQVQCLTVAPSVEEASTLISGSWDSSIRMWDLTSGQCVHVQEQAHENVVMSVMLYEQYLLSSSLDGTVKIWGPSSAGGAGFELTYTYPDDERGGRGKREGVLAMEGCVDAAGKACLLVAYNIPSGSRNTCRVVVYEMPTFEIRGEIHGPPDKSDVRSLASSMGLLFTGDVGGRVRVFQWKGDGAA